MDYPWRGNVRELNNEMERASALTVDDMVTEADLSSRLLDGLRLTASGPYSAASNDLSGVPPLNLQEAVHILLRKTPKETHGNKSKTAQLLSITREGLRKKLRRLGQGE